MQNIPRLKLRQLDFVFLLFVLLLLLFFKEKKGRIKICKNIREVKSVNEQIWRWMNYSIFDNIIISNLLNKNHNIFLLYLH